MNRNPSIIVLSAMAGALALIAGATAIASKLRELELRGIEAERAYFERAEHYWAP